MARQSGKPFDGKQGRQMDSETEAQRNRETENLSENRENTLLNEIAKRRNKVFGTLAIIQGITSANPLPGLSGNSLSKRTDSSSTDVDFVKGKNTGSTPVSFTNGCPCLDFTYHAQTQNTLIYHMDMVSVKWDHDNIYMITIHVYADEQISIENMWSLKIIGVDSPDGSTFQLYGHNENTYLINNPTDWTATFRGSATCDSTWSGKYKASSFDLITGCNNFDNNKRSQTDFPGYYWFKDHQQHNGVYPPSYACSKQPTTPTTTTTTADKKTTSTTTTTTPDKKTTSTTTTTTPDKKTTSTTTTTPTTTPDKKTTTTTTLAPSQVTSTTTAKTPTTTTTSKSTPVTTTATTPTTTTTTPGITAETTTSKSSPASSAPASSAPASSAPASSTASSS
ncbi:hypothetical protein C6P43_002217, partial [Kluyveromyces marxianus]